MNGNTGRGWHRRGNKDNQHDRRNQQCPQKPCRWISQPGGCRFGAGCKFSHDLGPTNKHGELPKAQRQKVELSSSEQMARDDYNEWKRLIKMPPGTVLNFQSEAIWNGALEILNSNHSEGHQKLPQDLDNPEYHGKAHILRLMTTSSLNYDLKNLKTVKDFLTAFTHPALIQSLAMNSLVGRLFNFMAGANGSVAIPFFTKLCTALIDQRSLIDTQEYITTSTSMITMIKEVLRRDRYTRLHDDLPALIDQIERMMDQDVSQACQHEMQWIKSMMTAARANLAGEDEYENHLPAAGIKSSYPRAIETPGGRHDNDYAEIGKIQIFPTMSELKSATNEFLPVAGYEESAFLHERHAIHFDTQFRLFRYDTFKELKDALERLFYAIEQGATKISSTRLNLGDLRAHQYQNAFISKTNFDKRHGLQFHITFPMPYIASLQQMAAPERRKWWSESRRLSEGLLLSLIFIEDSVVVHLFLEITSKPQDEIKISPASDQRSDQQLTIIAKLVGSRQEELEVALQMSCKKAKGLLLEYPGIIPGTFRPVLENLQRMQRESRLPFQDWILPLKQYNGQTSEIVNIPPPAYARRPGFTFSLSKITTNVNDEPLAIDPKIESDDSLVNRIKDQTTLDLGQCEALVSALTKELAFIQGPPGTGKSYLGIQLMQVLLSHKKQAHLGPIIVVCYTNHALDQFLEHLIKIGIDKVIRVGGSSKSLLLESHNLREVRRVNDRKTQAENYLAAQAYEAVDTVKETVDRDLAKLHGLARRKPEWRNFKDYLFRKDKKIWQQFQKIDKDGFGLAGKGDRFDHWTTTGSPLPDEADLSIDVLLQRARADVSSLSQPERVKLLDHWTNELRTGTLDNLYENIKEASTKFQELSNIHDESSRRVLQDTDVIGITTTGLAKNIALLQYVRAKVVVCEEAGEVMEPHMLSALLPSVEHLIQIGDHQQLRPQINTYGLSLECQEGLAYSLDRSQFERLVVPKHGYPKMPVVQLSTQRRMRPEISTLIRETLYPKLQDHGSTLNHPDIVGLRSNVLWLDHRNQEDRHQSDLHHKSHSNEWEVSMVQALVRHIIRQGVYRSEDIAVLAPYTGQVSKLRKVLSSDFEIVLNDQDELALELGGLNQQVQEVRPTLAKKSLSSMLRLATVDNFQGEEAKIIIVSLVRSNEDRKVGFLKTSNRINVLLSRAQYGMYLIGNSETYSGIPMWQKVIEILRADDNVKQSIGLCCPRHKDDPIEVFEPDDFEKLSPEGGCQESCPWRLDCGHMCQARCHSEAMHNVFPCSEPCQRLHNDCQHPCQKPTCGEDCGKCQVQLKDVELPCGHFQNIKCHQSGDLEYVKCITMIEEELEGCNHKISIPCFKKPDISRKDCTKACDKILSCGHICPGTCRQCRKEGFLGEISEEHQSCKAICKKISHECGHACNKKCHDGQPCGACTRPCEVRCQHSNCTKQCGEACAPCIEPCQWSCEHQGSCSMPCGGPCTRLPCNKRCSKNLLCGHRCPTVCGETCPEQAYCQECGSKTNDRIDLLEMKVFSEIDLEENPVVVLGCGHFFTIETLDGMTGMNQVYSTDEQGSYSGLLNISGELASHIPRCPDCKCELKQYVAQRYGRLVNRAIVDAMTRRFLIHGREELHKLTSRISARDIELRTSNRDWVNRTSQLIGVTNQSAIDKLIKGRYDASDKLDKDMQRLIRRSADSNQPASKINQAMVLASRRHQDASLEDQLASLGLEDSDITVTPFLTLVLGGRLAQIKLSSIVLEDKLSNVKVFGDSLQKLIELSLQASVKLIAECFQQNQPRLAIEATIIMAKLASKYSTSGSSILYTDLQTQAKTLAQQHVLDAQERCKALRQQDRSFADQDLFEEQLAQCLTLLSQDTKLSDEEMEAIKRALSQGPRGIQRSGGHWYRCANGHPFVIGECSMPMEVARCPECGESIGGQSHRALEGTTRAEDLNE